MVINFNLSCRKVIIYKLKKRSDNNIKNYFYSKFRRELRKIIKELLRDKNFQINYIQNGKIQDSKLSVNIIYKILRKNEISFENISKDIVYKMITSSFQTNTNSNSDYLY